MWVDEPVGGMLTGMQRGEVWWAALGDRCPVVLLDGDGKPEMRAIQIVAPASAEEKRGFVVMSGAEAADPEIIKRIVDAADPDVRAIGIEVDTGDHGVVRLALPRDGQIFCTWLVSLSADDLVEQIGELDRERLDQLTNALRIAKVE